MAAIDALTSDLVLTAGDLGPSEDSLLEAIHLRLATERGSCFWDVTFGSRLHLLRRDKLDTTFQVRLEDRVLEALKPLLDAGELKRPTFTHERDGVNGWRFQMKAQARRRTLTYAMFLEVG